MEKTCSCGERLIVHDNGATYCINCGAETPRTKDCRIINFAKPFKRVQLRVSGIREKSSQQRIKVTSDRGDYVSKRGVRR